MKKNIFKSLIVFLILAMSMSVFPTVVFAAGDLFEVDGYDCRLDKPTSGPDTNKWHVHVNDSKGREVGVESVDGSPSHKQTLAKVPRKTRGKIRAHSKWKKGVKEQAKLDKATAQIKSKGLNLNKTGDIIIAIAIVAAATLTWFFPGDDIASWGNLLRVITT